MKRSARNRLIVLGLTIGVFLFALYSLRWKDENPIKIEVTVDDSQIYIGVPIKYTINVRMLPGIEAEIPDEIGDFGGLTLETITTSPKKKRLSYIVQSKNFYLISFSPGSYRLPSPIVRYTEGEETFEIHGQEMIIEVKSAIPEGEEPVDIRDIKPPLKPRSSYLLPWGILIILFLGMLWFWWRRKKMRERQVYQMRFTAHQIAYEQLIRIKDLRLVERGMIKEYYSLLSNCVRQYIENRYGLRARRMTTQEFLLASLNSKAIGEEERSLLHDFLSKCDMVKFARYTPIPEELEEVYRSAKRFIDGTIYKDTPLGEEGGRLKYDS